MTGLNIQCPAFFGYGVIIWQVFIRILRYYGSKAVGRTVKIFPLPSPPPREGACSRKSYLRSNNCHCERQNGASQSHNIYINNEITTSNASHSPRNDMKDLCKPQVADGTATFPRNDREDSCKTQGYGWSGTLLIFFENPPAFCVLRL